VLAYGNYVVRSIERHSLGAALALSLIWVLGGLVAINIRRRLVRGPSHRVCQMHGKLCVVTGANTGVGLDTARELAAMGAEVVLACRTESKAETAMRTIWHQHPGANIRFLQLDLGSLESVRACAAKLLDANRPVDVLINNAGVMLSEATESKDGIDLAFQANHLGHFLLTTLCLPLIQRAPGGGRVVNLGSAIHHIPKKLDITNLAHRTSFPGMFEVYSDTKLCNALFTAELNRRFGRQGVGTSKVAQITAFCVHPGTVITSEVARNLPPLVVYINSLSLPLTKLVAKAGVEGCYSSLCAATTLTLASTDPADPGCPAAVGYVANCALAYPNPLAADPILAKQLWVLSDKLIGTKDK
jgi:NAD(P)-dependent dehydrogenase (short-subunit alcohol dehydrogenase family)